jgi:alternate signal-mediated exported protein
MRRRRPQHRRRRSGRIRAVLGLGILLGVSQVGTLASWTDSATIQGGTLTSGTLDLLVGENVADQLVGQGGTWVHASLSLNGMVPGESVARMLTVKNGGSARLNVNGTLATDTNALTGSNTGLQVTVVQDATSATNSGAVGNNDRTGVCVGGTATQLTGNSVSTASLPLLSGPVSLPSGAEKKYCVMAKLANSSPDGMQGKSVTLTLTFNAGQ